MAKFFVPAFCLATSLAAFGTNISSSGSGAFTTGANWTGGVAPGTGDGAIINGTAMTLASSTSVTNLAFQGTNPSISGGSGVTLSMSGGVGGTGTPSAFNWSAANITVSGGMTVEKGSTGAWNTQWNGSSGVLNLENDSRLLIDQGGFVALTSSTKSVTSATTGRLHVNTGGTFLVAGGNNSATIQSGVTFALNGGTLRATQGTIDIKSTTASLNGTVDYNGSNAGTVTYSGAGTLTIGSQLTTSLSSTDNDTLSISAGTLSFSGTTTLQLAAKTLSVLNGVTVTGTAGVTTSSGTLTLSGNTVAMTPGGTATAGTLDFGGVNVTWSGTTQTLTIDVAEGAGADDHVLGGAITLGSGLSLTINNLTGSAWSPSNTGQANKITIINGSSLSGTFVGLADESLVSAGGQQFMVDYTAAGDVDLIPVPEPAHYAGAIGLGLVGFAALRRRASRKA